VCKLGICIAIANQKGGVTKTTSTYNIAALISRKKYKVLMIDLDAQCSLSISAGIESNNEKNNDMLALLQGKKNAADCIHPVRNNLDIIPSNPLLSGIEKNLSENQSRESILKQALLSITNKYDYIFIDCQPQLSLFTINAFVVSQYVLIPCATTYLSYRGIELLINTVNEVIGLGLNNDLKVMGVIATLYEKQVIDHREVLDVMREKYNIIGTLRKSAEANKGIYSGSPIVFFNQNHPLSYDYQKIADYILRGEAQEQSKS
jgi:chromosome partitioning protein